MRYFDLHCDTAGVCHKKGIFPDDASLAASLKKGEMFDEWHQCYAVFIPDGTEDPKALYNAIIKDFNAKISKAKNIKAILTLENALPIDDPDFADRLFNDNIKAVTLTWNFENRLAGGVYSDARLKDFGRQVIAGLNEKNIACDLSHLNRRSFFEAGEAARVVFASHTCCDKTHRHPRNLTDEQIRYLADRGGVIGVCFYPEFLGTKYALEGVRRHIYHLLNMGLENHICIGSDFDGADMADCLDGVDKIPDLRGFLYSNGVSNDILDKMFFKNALEFFKKNFEI